MAKKDLLAEAIADAKKVKSTALANAKMALEEAFQPTLQRMISSRLAEEEEFEDDGDDFDINIEVEPEVELPDEEPMDAPEAEPVGMGSFDDGGEEEVPEEEPLEGEENVELESLIRELEGDEEDDLFEGEEEDWQDPIPDDPMNENDGYDDEYSSGDNELTEAEIRALSSLFEEEGLGDIDGPEDEDGGSFTENPTPEMNQENRRLRRENARLRKENNDAYRVVTSLKKTINEVNLLNAKLMFTTRALRVPSLTESQQIRIMKQIDRANSVREAKLVYTTILEALNRRPAKRTMTEGFASKSTKAINPTPRDKRRLNESAKSDDVVRWQRLAGIIPPADF